MVLKAYGCSIAWCRHELSATHFIKNLVSTYDSRSLKIVELTIWLPVVLIRLPCLPLSSFALTVGGDWRFDYLSCSHLQSQVNSQVKSRRRMMVFMHLVVVWIGQFCRDVIGRQNVKVAVIGRLLFCGYFRSVYCLLRYVGFVWGHAWVFCKVQVIVGIGSEVLVLSLCTSFLMSVFVGRLHCKWRIQQSPSRFCV